MLGGVASDCFRVLLDSRCWVGWFLEPTSRSKSGAGEMDIGRSTRLGIIMMLPLE